MLLLKLLSAWTQPSNVLTVLAYVCLLPSDACGFIAVTVYMLPTLWLMYVELISLQAFDDCTTIASIFKLLDSFEGLLDRGVIATDLERKHLDLVRDYGQDLKEVADTFRETKDSPPLNKNAAPHSGRVTWVRGLKERVGGTHKPIDQLACCSSAWQFRTNNKVC